MVEIDLLPQHHDSSRNFRSSYGRARTESDRPGQPTRGSRTGSVSPPSAAVTARSSVQGLPENPFDSPPDTPSWKDNPSWRDTPSWSGRATPLDSLHPPRPPYSEFGSRPASSLLVCLAAPPVIHLCISVADKRALPHEQNPSELSLTALLPGGASPVLAKDWIVRGSVARLHDRDDADIWKGWKRHLFRFVPLLTVAATGLYLLYLGLRIACLITAQKAQGRTFPQAWVFVAVEVAVAIPSIMHNIWTMWAIKKRSRPKLRLTGDDGPTVDVFVTCCREDDDVILDTVRAACDLDYPRDRFRVVVLDDGKSAALEASVNRLAMTTYPNLFYVARPKAPGVPHHFKAGNLNFGLDWVHSLPGGASKFMAALDADMVSLFNTSSCHRRVPTPLDRVLTAFPLFLLRFPSVTGCVLSCLTCLLTPGWPLLALPSSSTTPPPPTLSRKVLTSSCT